MSKNWDVKKHMPDLTGKVAIVTGGNAGIGKETVRYLALNNAKVYMASRTELRALNTISDIKKQHPEIQSKPGIYFLQLDLMDLKACQAAARDFLEKEDRLDILVNNAGIGGNPYGLTQDGIEIQFQTNYLGHFAFTYPLLPILVRTSKKPDTSVRVVQVSSNGYGMAPKDIKFDSAESVNREFGGTLPRYGLSKLANILFARELACRYSQERIWSTACTPGPSNTEMTQKMFESWPWAKYLIMPFKLFFNTPLQGAHSVLYAAASPDIEKNDWRGEYFLPPAKLYDTGKKAKNEALGQELWELSEKLVAEKCGGLL